MASSRRQGNGTTPTPAKQRSITSFFSPGSKPSPFTPPSASHSNPKPKLLIPPSSTPSSRDGPEAIGRRIRVFWPLDNQWYEGSVVSFDRVVGKHSIQYDDGEQEQLDLSQEKFEWADVSPPQSFRRLRKISGDDRSVSPDTDMEMVDAEEDGDDPDNADWGKDDRNVYEIAGKDVNGSSGETLRSRKRTKDGSCTPGSRDTGTQKRRIQALGRISGGRSPERNVSDLLFSQEYKEKHDQNSARSNNAGTGACARATGTDLSGELLERFGRRELEKFGFLGKGRRDANGRKPGDENYDSRTLKLPTDFLKSLSGGQRQWWEFKSKHMDKVLFFKMGKFYELFEMDAHVGARELDLQYMKGEQPHCGFPEKNFEMFVEKLARKGYRVLVVEQTETPEQLELRRKEMGSKDKVVKREICAVVTKGTLVEGEMMSVNVEASYLMSVTERLNKAGAGYNDDDNVILGVCLVDASTSRFILGQFEDDHGRNILRSLLSELRPVELIKPSNMLSPKTEKVLLENTRNPLVNDLIPGIEFWDAQRTLSEWRRVFEKNASSRSLGANKLSVPDNFDVFGMNNVLLPDVLIELENAAENGQYALSAFGGCLFYLGQALMDASLLRYARFELLPYSGSLNAPEKPYMMLDASALENLDIFESTNGSSTSTLFAQLDYCVTAFGKRLLKSWLARPLCDPKSIMDRQLAVSDLKDIALDSVVEFRKMLAKVPDMERLLSRLFANCETSGRNANKVILYEDAARKQLREFISALRGCQLMVESHSKFGSIKDKLQSTMLRHLLSTGDAFPDIEATLRHFKDAFDWSEAEQTGRVVPQEGVDAECDFACTSVADIENNLGKYLKEQQKLLGSNSVTYVTVGKDQYLLEVTEDLQGSIPPEYELHSSRKGYFRYWSPKLKMLLGELAIAEDEKESKLKSILQRLMIRFCEHHLKLRQLVFVIAELDVLGSLAISSNYYEGPICMPVILDGSCSKDPPALSGQCLGHPILKSDAMVKGSFVPNNVNIGGAGNPSFILLTGPNMGGKSTFLRQACLAVILAQIGAFVPAESFHLSPVDRIFVRMGAKDHIMAGQSTFLTELSETATMMLCATRNSLVALDELGRGTSTSDGQAIAESVLDYFVSKLGCRGIFSTHYHRLAVKYANNPQVSLCHMACQVDKDVNGIEEVLFLYKLTSGACPKSYGVNVARLAGIPDSVLRKASSKSTSFEAAYGKRKNVPGEEYFDMENADGTAHLQDLLDAIVRMSEQNVQTCKDPRGFLHEFQQKARLFSR